MSSIPFETLLTYLYVLVDDWYKAEGVKLMQGKVVPHHYDSCG